MEKRLRREAIKLADKLRDIPFSLVSGGGNIRQSDRNAARLGLPRDNTRERIIECLKSATQPPEHITTVGNLNFPDMGGRSDVQIVLESTRGDEGEALFLTQQALVMQAYWRAEQSGKLRDRDTSRDFALMGAVTQEFLKKKRSKAKKR